MGVKLIKKIILLSFILFSLGLFGSNIYSINMKNETQQNATTENPSNDLMKLEELEKSNKKIIGTKDKPSPYERIEKEQIFVYDDEVVIKIKNPQWAVFTDTKSMDPVIDSTSKAIEIVPKSESEIHVGDIAAYQSKYKDGIVIHRVVKIEHDAFGWYAILKGDNNDLEDPGKIRFDQIKMVVIAIIY